MLVQNIGSQKRAQAAVRIQLHTGRTHQIRVHFEAIGCSLLGMRCIMERWIKELSGKRCIAWNYFTHPFTKETVHLISPLAEDMKSVDDTL